MDVAITGSTGLIGSALVGALRDGGHTVRPVVRSGGGQGSVRWDIDAGTIDAEALAGVDAVVHLAGEGIAERRWSEKQKDRILRSRVDGTSLIARTVAALDPQPSVLLCASGISVYGDQGDRELTEADPAAEGFLPDVVRAWEGAAAPAVDAGIRTAHLRSGIVLDASGGALAKQLPLFKLGLGGRFGRGRQWMPWISLADEVGAVLHLLDAPVSGPVNLTAPHPVTNAEFTATLAEVLGRPAIVPIPKLAPSLVLGRELTETLLYWSTRALPAVLEASGYRFRHPTLELALRDLLQRPAA
jgi:uncharacterized protein (TIGR01777 family)